MTEFKQVTDRKTEHGAEQEFASQLRPFGPGDLAQLATALDALRRSVPPEVQTQLAAFAREGLLTVRALIDWYLERLDTAPRPPRVEDIPIE